MGKKLIEYCSWNRWILFLGSISHFGISFIVDRYIVKEEIPSSNLVFYFTAKIIFMFMIIYLWQIIPILFKKCFQRDEFSYVFVRHFLTFFLLLIIVMLLIWPGAYTRDEILNFLYWTQNCSTWSFVHVFSGVYYGVALQFFPFMGGVLIFQLCVISAIGAYIVSRLVILPNVRKSMIWLFYLPIFSPFILEQSMNPTRYLLSAYLLLFIFEYLFLAAVTKTKLSILNYCFIGVLSGIIGAWRSEHVIFIVLLPMCFLLLMMKEKKWILNISFYFISMVIVYSILGNLQNYSINKSQTNKEQYTLTAFIMPLSNMLQHELRSNDLVSDLEIIDQVLDVEKLKLHPSVYDIDALWYEAELIRTDYSRADFKKFEYTTVKLIAMNPGIFMKYRFETFLASNGFHAYKKTAPFYAAELYDQTYGAVENVNVFVERFGKLAYPIDKNLRKNLCELLEGNTTNLENQKTMVSYFFYNTYLAYVLLIVMIIRLLKSHNKLLILPLSLLIKSALTFLIAPASFLYYYLPEYLVGIEIAITYFLVCDIDLKHLSIKIFRNRKA